MLTGWLTDSTGKKYFLDNDLKELGKLTRGWKKIDNNYYFLDFYKENNLLSREKWGL